MTTMYLLTRDEANVSDVQVHQLTVYILLRLSSMNMG